MISHKHITKFVAILMAVAVCLCLCAIALAQPLASSAGGSGVTMEYETELFDTSQPITVNILMDETDWDEMLANATAEVYYSCDVEINGQRFYNVGVRPKGNTSLSAIASNPDTDRYSFKLEFDQFVEGQTCYGLDKLVLNNNYADATNMKEALVYDMYQYLGADASLYNVAEISVNGEYWGVYLALEAVEDSFLLRNYGVSSGELYKPEGVGGGGGRGSMDSAGGGADLNYVDDDLDSYSTIWEGEVTGTTDKDHARVVEALKAVSQGKDLETYMDVDNLLRYMAVHVFSVNQDSLSGSMAHNYYLYEYNSQLNIIPWDYNLVLGGMGGMGGGTGGGDASGTINDPIDESFSSTSFFDPLLENETYLEQYHAYLRQLVEEYVFGGQFEEFYNRMRGQLDDLVADDPTAFYSSEEYDDAAQTLYQVVTLRAQSIQGQLDGTIPSTQSGQREDPSALVDTGDLDLSIMGTMDMNNGDMGGGGGFDGFGGGFQFGNGGFLGDGGLSPDAAPDQAIQEVSADEFSASKTVSSDGAEVNGDPPEVPSGAVGQAPEGAGGQMPEGAVGQAPQSIDGQATESADGQASSETDAQASDNADSQAQESPDIQTPSDANGEMPGNFDGRGQEDFGGEMPEGFDGMGPDESQSSSVKSNLILYGICFVILLAALAFAAAFKRRSRRR